MPPGLVHTKSLLVHLTPVHMYIHHHRHLSVFVDILSPAILDFDKKVEPKFSTPENYKPGCVSNFKPSNQPPDLGETFSIETDFRL
jgi:hypothetical protein